MKNQSVAVLPNSGHRHPFSIDPDKILQSIVDVVCVIDEKGTFLYLSASSTNLFGFSPGEMVGNSFLDYICPEDIQKTVQAISERTDRSTSNFTNRYYRKDGSLVSISWSGRWDKTDNLLYCVARDGSEQFEIGRRLVKAQQMARVANFEFDVTKNCFSYTSETISEILGLDINSVKHITAEHFFSMVHPEDRSRVEQSLDYPTEKSIEYRIIRPDGSVAYINRVCEVVRDAAGNKIKVVGTLQDVTNCKLSEMAVRQSELRFRSLVQKGNDLIAIIDTEGNYSFVGENVKDHLGYTEDELLGKSAFPFIHPDDAGWVGDSLQKITELQTMLIGPYRFLHASGEWRWIETTVSNHLGNPAINGLVVNSKDVTDKKLADDELNFRRERFKSLVQNGSDIILIIDEKANFSYISDNVTSILGYSNEELVGRNAFEFIHPDDVENVNTAIRNVLEGNEKLNGVQHRFLHKNGDWLWLESKGTNHQRNYTLRGILVNSRNINERVQLQKSLDQALINKQKEITSAVIKAQETERSLLGLELHDNVNQILTTVKLYNEMYLTGYVQNKELLIKSTQYTQDCINEIRSISKRLSAPTLGKITLKDSIAELVDSINLSKRIKIAYKTGGIDQCNVSEDLHLAIYRIVQESLNNIIKYSQAQTASIEICRSENLLCLHISDNGKGFDTSAKREGIGITNMKTRAENMNASFRIISTPGKGCKVEICFPFKEAFQQLKEEKLTLTIAGD